MSLPAHKARIHRMISRKVKEEMDRQGYLVGVRRVLVGISGGVDSGVLLHLLAELGSKMRFELVAAHVHHGMRGDEADRDAGMAEEVARKHATEFHLVRVKPSKGKFSAEHHLRELRLEALERLARNLKCERIALAHHLDDQAETLFLRLMGGADLRGLRGIRAFRPPCWIRPLLHVTREEILTEAAKCHIPFIEDSSNLQTHARRNYVRKNLFPVLKTQFNPKLSQHLAHLADSFSEVTDYMEEQAEKALRRAARKRGEILVSTLRRCPSPIRNTALQIAYRRLAGEGKALRREQLRVISRLVLTDGERRNYALPGGVRAERLEGVIRFLKNPGTYRKNV